MKHTTAWYVDIDCQKCDETDYLREDPRQTRTTKLKYVYAWRQFWVTKCDNHITTRFEVFDLSLGKPLHVLRSCQVVITVEGNCTTTQEYWSFLTEL